MSGSTRENRFEKTARVLHSLGAYTIKPNDPFIGNSGIIMPHYANLRRPLIDHRKRCLISWYLSDVMDEMERETGREFEYVIAMESADIPFASWVADYRGMPFGYVHKAEKAHGIRRRIAGPTREELKGKYCIHVGDVATRGHSGEDVASVVRADEAVLDRHVVVLDRDQGAVERLRCMEKPVYLDWLTRVGDEFHDIGIEMGAITDEEVAVVKEYQENPAVWAKRFLREHPDFVIGRLRPDVRNGRIIKTDALEVLTKGYPELQEEFTKRIWRGLAELGVRHSVPEFGYRVR